MPGFGIILLSLNRYRAAPHQESCLTAVAPAKHEDGGHRAAVFGFRQNAIVEIRMPAFHPRQTFAGLRWGIDKLSGQGRGEPRAADRSGGGGRRDPNAIGFGSEEAKGGPADHVALRVEGVVEGGVGGEKPLG